MASKETAAQKKKRLALEAKQQQAIKDAEQATQDQLDQDTRDAAAEQARIDEENKAKALEDQSKAEKPEESLLPGADDTTELPTVKTTPVSEEQDVVTPAVNSNTPAFKIITIAINEYLHVMDPSNGIGEAEQMKKQIRLYRALQSAFLLSGEELPLTVSSLVELFKDHREGAFSTSVCFRNMDNIALPSKDIVAFTALLHLFSKAAAVGMGNVFKHVDLPLLEERLTDKRAAEVAIAMFSAQ